MTGVDLAARVVNSRTVVRAADGKAFAVRNSVSNERLAELKARIAAIEKQPLPDRAALPAGEGSAPSLLALTRPLPGLLQEIYADRRPDGGAALGFALALVRDLVTLARPAVFFLQLVHAAQEAGLPYALGLPGFGLTPDRLVLGRLAHVKELLWAIEEAIACRAVAAVVAELPDDTRALDFTASRRLSLRAAAGGASVLLLRYGEDRMASAARLRWHVAPAPSQAPPFDALAPGPPRWRATLERSSLPQSVLRGGEDLLLDWTENGFIPIRPDATGPDVPGAGPRRPPPSGAPPALLGDRLAQAG
jgi:protein ImuA